MVVPVERSMALVIATPLNVGVPVTSKPLVPPSTPMHNTTRRFVPPPRVWLNVRVSLVVVAEVALSNAIAAHPATGARSTPASRRVESRRLVGLGKVGPCQRGLGPSRLPCRRRLGGVLKHTPCQ